MALESLTATLIGSAAFTAKKTVSGVQGSFADTLKKTLSLTTGTGVDNVNQLLYEQTVSIAASATKTIDVKGAVNDVFGDSVDFDQVKGILIINSSANVGTIFHLGGTVPYLSGTSPKIILPQNGFMFLGTGNATGFAVTAGTADTITVENQDGTNAGQIDYAILGVT